MDQKEEQLKALVEKYRQDMLDFWQELIDFQAGSKEKDRMQTLMEKVAARLEKEGVHVKIVESSLPRCQELSSLLPDTDIIHGDVSDQDLLISEGMAQYDALVTCTGRDELNMIVVRGAIPGPKGGVVYIKNTVKNFKAKGAAANASINPQKASARTNPQKASARNR